MAHKVQPSLSNISLNHDSGASSLQEQLYFKILDLIENKSLRPGDPIPSSRKLASEIEVSRLTVVSVYNRLLEEGLLETKSGNGTFVSENFLSVYLKIERKVCQLMRNISPQNSRFLHKSQRRPLASKFKSLCPSQ